MPFKLAVLVFFNFIILFEQDCLGQLVVRNFVLDFKRAYPISLDGVEDRNWYSFNLRERDKLTIFAAEEFFWSNVAPKLLGERILHQLIELLDGEWLAELELIDKTASLGLLLTYSAHYVTIDRVPVTVADDRNVVVKERLHGLVIGVSGAEQVLKRVHHEARLDDQDGVDHLLPGSVRYGLERRVGTNVMANQ